MSGPQRYRLEAQGSRLTVRVSAGGPLAAFGHDPVLTARDLRGDMTLDPEALGSASLRMVIRPESLSLTSQASDGDRREIERRTRDEVLEAGTHPEIVYDCPAGKVTAHGPLQLTLGGELTLHGVTRPHPVSVRLFLTGDTLRAQGESALRQSEYRIRQVTAGGGLLKVKDEVRLAFDLVGQIDLEPPGP